MRLSTNPTRDYSVAYFEQEEFLQIARESVLMSVPEHLQPLFTRGTSRGGFFSDDPITLANIEFPPRCVFVPDLQPHCSAQERTRYGALLAHEVSHAKGGDEWEARSAERHYLCKQGLQGPTNLQIWKEIVSILTHPDDIESVERGCFGNNGSLFVYLLRCFRTWFVKPYLFEDDWQSNGQ